MNTSFDSDVFAAKQHFMILEKLGTAAANETSLRYQQHLGPDGVQFVGSKELPRFVDGFRNRVEVYRQLHRFPSEEHFNDAKWAAFKVRCIAPFARSLFCFHEEIRQFNPDPAILNLALMSFGVLILSAHRVINGLDVMPKAHMRHLASSMYLTEMIAGSSPEVFSLVDQLFVTYVDALSYNPNFLNADRN